MSSPSTSKSVLTPETEDVPKTETVEQEPTPEKGGEETPAVADAAAAQWQAVWSQEYNAYYFYNHTTQQTTWTNPLVPDANAQASMSQQGQEPSEAEAQAEGEGEGEGKGEGSSSTNQPPMSSVVAQQAAIHAAAVSQGIDPILARLDPSLVASATAGSGGSAVGGSLPTFTAQFNARTGRFTTASLPSSSSSSSQPVRTPAHLSEYERAKRMSSFYFDVDKWEEDLAKRGGRLMGEEGDGDGAEGGAEGGKKRKRPSKKDIERYKEQKKQKKIAKTAWLRT